MWRFCVQIYAFLSNNPLFIYRKPVATLCAFVIYSYFCTMEINIDRNKWYDRLLAAFIFFTRLPFWRLHQPPKDCYRSVVEYWPLTGWLTGGLMAGTLWLGSMVLPWAVAVLLSIVVRLLLTGALHEDGLADFFDGFGGGGSDRSRILAIMKDSHIGTYGVLGLVAYILLLAATLFAIGGGFLTVGANPGASLQPLLAALAIIAADPFAKMVTAQLVMMMPYARREEEAKGKVVYRKMDWKAGIGLAVQGLLPMVAFIWLTDIDWQMIIFIPCLVMYFLYRLIWSRLHGYTGDCCGAVCLLVELAVYLVICVQQPILNL